MLHKVFNEKEEMQWHRTETKKHSGRVQGGTENGPFPKDKLHTQRLPFPILLYLVAIPAHQHQSLTPAPSRRQQEVQQSGRERALSQGAQSKAEAEEAGRGLPCSEEQRAQVPPARWDEDTQPICKPWPRSCCCRVPVFLPAPKGMICRLQQFRLQRGGGRHSPEPPRPREPPEEMGTPPALRELPTAADREDPTAVL